VEDVTAGQYKRTLTPYKKITSGDRWKMQKDVEDIHALFKGFVHRHRPALNIAAVSTGEVSSALREWCMVFCELN
jgi:serine protease SohB